MTKTATACGKLILSGEYAGVFGFRGIAFPSLDHSVTVSFDETPGASSLMLHSVVIETEHPAWKDYMTRIISLCQAKSAEAYLGKLTISGNIPVGKGMGSSTALVIATCKCLLGDNATEELCRSVEENVNVGSSGIDFGVIWKNAPIIFKKGSPLEEFDHPYVLENTTLIDTGTPDQTTPELIAWMKTRVDEPQIKQALKTIGQCTERILRGENLKTVMKDHHRAQVALGVVPKEVQELIAGIEEKGGAGKVLGAGARTGGGGMVLQIP